MRTQYGGREAVRRAGPQQKKVKAEDTPSQDRTGDLQRVRLTS